MIEITIFDNYLLLISWSLRRTYMNGRNRLAPRNFNAQSADWPDQGNPISDKLEGLEKALRIKSRHHKNYISLDSGCTALS